MLKDKDGKPYLNDYGDIALNDTRTNNLPGVHPVMQEMRAYADKFDSNQVSRATRVLIGETYLPNIAELDKQYGPPDHPEFQLPMDTQLGFINKLDVADVPRSSSIDAENISTATRRCCVFDNHDNPRIDARYGDGVHDTDIERVISTVLFASRGAALFYYGDEIGMKTTPPTRKEDVKDPVGIHRLAQGEGPRRRAHADAVGCSSANAGLYLSRRLSLGCPFRPTTQPSTSKQKAEPESLLDLVRDA